LGKYILAESSEKADDGGAVTEELEFDAWPIKGGGEIVEFRLIYNGRLPAASASDTRSVDKHRIRKELHKQLKELWKVCPPLSEWSVQKVPAQNSPTGKESTVLQVIAHNWQRNGFRFAPIVTEGHALACELSVLFLRRDAPGKVITQGGDIDNRIKVLFDALRMPKDGSEIGGAVPDADEDPFFVLLEDDALITKISVTTDRLLTPLLSSDSKHDVHLIIGVKVKVITVSRYLSNLEFLN
jgi:hypothetical protein